jgi:hypothetical protein
MMTFFPNTFKDNIAQVPAVIDDTLLKPFTEVVHDFAGHRGRNGGDFLSYCLLDPSKCGSYFCHTLYNVIFV